jgi:hypothetical protein
MVLVSAFTVLIFLFDTNRRNAISYLSLASIVPILALILWVTKVNPIIFIKEFIKWGETYDGSEALYHSAYGYFTIIIAALFISILFYLLLRNQAAKILIAIALFAMLIILSIQKFDIHKFVVGICIFYMLSIMIEICGNLYSRKVGKKEKKQAILYLFPICLLLALIAVGMPSRPEPIQWKGVKNLAKSLRETVEYWITEIEYRMDNSGSEFALTYSGYSENDNELGSGFLQEERKVVLKVMATSKSTAPVYLVGSVSDIYTGTSWVRSKSKNEKVNDEYYLDYAELLFGLSRQDQDTLENSLLVERRNLQLIYDKIKTKTMFYPLKSSHFELSKSKQKINSKNPSMVFPKVIKPGTTIKEVYYEMNLKGEHLQNILRKESDFSYEDNQQYDEDALYLVEKGLFSQDNASSPLSIDGLYDILTARAKEIQEKYTTLPEELPDRVKELALSITEGFDNKYDKLKAIEEYLKGYFYTVNPGEIPKDVDFVDYFLFEGKEGYCTSFASSMAILGRCVGIPTRYVEGFIVNYKEKEPGSVYLVRSNNAHAWAEAYIEGFGWIPFEATPPFFDSRYVAWKDDTNVAEASSSYYEGNTSKDRADEITQGEKTEEPIIIEEEEEDYFKQILLGSLLFFAAISITIMMFVIYYLVLKVRYQKSYERADNNRRMYLRFVRILDYLRREGYVLSPQETILMLSNRMSGKYTFNQVSFEEVADTFMKFRYAEEPITEDELGRVTIFYDGMQEKQKKEQNPIKLLLEDFLFLNRRKFS